MIDPMSLSAGAIAVLIATKAFEKTGERLGESTWTLVNKFLSSLKRKSPSTATAIEKVAQNPELAEQKPDEYGVTVLIRQVEEAAKDDPEINQVLLAIADAIKNKPNTIANLTKIADKIGTLSQGNENIFNISNNF